MKDQINKFARGVFDYEPPMLESEEGSVCRTVYRNKDYFGRLRFFERNGKELRGIVYSDNDKVVIRNNTFLGSDATIEYSVKGKGTPCGDVIEGHFSVVSNGGEEIIPFSFRVEAGAFETSIGQVKNLFHFTNLAQTDIDEAMSVFESEDFEDIYIGEDAAKRCIYECLSKGDNTRNKIEEFLIAVHKKNKINFSLPRNNAIFENFGEVHKDSITIEKDGWGYADIEVSTDAPFIKLERHQISTDAFAGNKYDFFYFIEADKLHNGRNYGKILFKTPGQTKEFVITISKNHTDEEDRKVRTVRKLKSDLLTLYIRLRNHTINIAGWIRESKIIIEAIRVLDDTDPYYRLALAQVYITENHIEAARELTENVRDEINPEETGNYPLYCYFIYVNSLMNKDRSYAKRAAAKIREVYERQCDDWLVLWTLLFVDEELEHNKSLKLLRIKEQFNRGCHSPALYIEACRILNEQPILIRVLNSFEINVLNFGIKYGMLDEKLCTMVAEMIAKSRFGTDKFIDLLMKMNENYNFSNRVILESLCKILIRNECTGEKYLPIYDRAIREELKITRLFDYFIMSRRTDDMTPVPKMLLMYFGYNNSLDYIRKAYLYANVICNKDENPDFFKTYIPQMEAFMMEQLLLCHINDNLAIIYRELMKPELITEENAEAVSEIYFTCKIDFSNNFFDRLVVRHKESSSEKEYPINGNSAFVRLYTDDATIAFISENKNRYASSYQYTIKKLFDRDDILDRCLEICPELIHVKLRRCEKNIAYQRKNLEIIENILDVSKAGVINRFFKKKLTTHILDFFYENYDEDDFEKFIPLIDTDNLDDSQMIKLIELYIVSGKYEEAYELLKTYSIMDINPKRLLKLCAKLVLNSEGEEKDETLLHYCYYVFSHGRYDELVLGYLVDNYNGTSQEMASIWKKAREFGLDTYDLEERLLAQMLFTHSYAEPITDIFEHYYSKGPKDRIVEAYLAYSAYLYFVKEQIMTDEFIGIIEAHFENEKNLAQVCKIALLKYYSELSELSDFRREIGEKLIEELVRMGFVFPFFTKLTGKIRVPIDIEDKTIIEYRTNPNSRVSIYYRYDGAGSNDDYIGMPMNNVYEGIFVKQFILFYGETLSYYIVETDENGQNITESRSIMNRSVNTEKSDNRYEKLNDIISCHDMHDARTFDKLVNAYAVNEYAVEQLFKPIN